MTPLARDELTGPRGAGYRRMIELSAAGRAGTPGEVATVAALLMGSDGGFITGSDFLMDGGVTAAYWFGELAPQWAVSSAPWTQPVQRVLSRWAITARSPSRQESFASEKRSLSLFRERSKAPPSD